MSNFSRRQVLQAGLSAATVAAAPGALAQAGFPSRPIKFIVPYPPGGATDLVGRLLAAKVQEAWGQTVVVENRAGASGMIGSEQVARSAPDGYTALVGITTHIQNSAIFARVPYDPIKDFQPISQICLSYLVLVVKPDFPANNLKEFVALVKANPGKYSFASPGTGSLGHANIENFMNLAGIDLLHIPYKGAGQAATDALAGQVNAMTDNLPSTLANIQSGKLRPLAVLALKRSPVLPDVPTYTELGYAGMGDGGWFGLVAPAGTPKEIIAKLNAAAHKAMAMPDYLEKQKGISGESMANQPAEFAKQIDAAIARYTAVAKRANIKLD